MIMIGRSRSIMFSAAGFARGRPATQALPTPRPKPLNRRRDRRRHPFGDGCAVALRQDVARVLFIYPVDRGDRGRATTNDQIMRLG
jgi:hypothetical protein